MKKTNQNKKLAKMLATTIFGVGFVAPLMFSNIVDAANFGAGGSTTPTFTADKIDAAYAYKSTGKDSISDSNCLMINGYRFKVVGNTTTNGKQILTLWSYDKQDHGGTTGLGESCYSSGHTWGTANDQTSIQGAYKNNVVSTYMNTLLTVNTATGKATAGKLYGDDASKNIVYIPYTSTGITNEADVSDAYIWIPSKTEVESTAWGNGTTALTNAQRAIGHIARLRSPYTTHDYLVYAIDYSGAVGNDFADYANMWRPALQILNQTSYVFTTNVTIPTDGVFTADSGGSSPANYRLNDDSTAGFVPGFTPATDGVTLDGTKIGITTVHSKTGGSDNDYVTTGLLTKEADSAKNDTWAHLNGVGSTVPTSDKGISYMAQVSSDILDLSGVATDTDYTLKVFGLKTADTTVTELAGGAITGLSKGADGKIHMKVKDGTTDGINNGVAVTLKNGAVVDLAGDASNAITLDSSGTDKTGKLNLGASTYTHSGDIAIGASGTLTVEGTGTLVGTVSGAGKIVIDGIVSADTSKFIQTGGLEVASTKELILTAGTLSKAVSNNGTVKLNGATLDGAHVTAGTLEFAQNMETNASYVAATTNKVDSGVTLTLTAGNLSKAITNDATGTVKLNGATLDGAHVTAGTLEFAKNISMDAAYVAASTNKVDSGVTLTLTAGTLSKDVTNSGTIKTNGNVTINSKLTGGTLEVTGGTTKYTGTERIGSVTVVDSGAELDPAANLLNADTTVNGTGVLDVSSGELTTSIKGDGTVILKDLADPTTAQTITVKTEGLSIAGTLKGNGGTLDMTGDSANKTFTIGTLADTTNLKIDVDMSSFTADKLAVTNIDGATVNLSAINITKDITSTPLVLPKEEKNKITYVTSINGTATYTLTPSAGATDAIVLTNNYKYTFTKGTEDGKLNYKVEATDLTFKKFVEGTLPGYTADPATLSLTADLANTGTSSDVITEGATQSNDAITVNLNGHNLTSAASTNITVGDTGVTGKSIKFDGGAAGTAGSIDGNTNFEVKSNNTLALAGNLVVNGTITNAATEGVTVAGTVNTKGVITGAGSLKINGGTLTADAGITQTAGITVAGATDKLIIGAANLLSTVTSSGTVELKAGTLGNYNITGGKITISGNVEADPDNLLSTGGITNDMAGQTLTLSDGAIGDNISGAGTTVINGTVTNTKNIANKVTVNSGKSLSSSAGTISGDVANNGGAITITGGEINTVTNTASATLTALTTSLKGAITNTSGTVTINGGTDAANTVTLASAATISGTGGKTVIDGFITNGGATISNSPDAADGITINNGKVFITNADNIGTGVTNAAGSLYLTGGALAKAVAGAGNTYIGKDGTDVANVTSSANIENPVTVYMAAALTVTAGTLSSATALDNMGNLTLNGGSISSAINSCGTFNVKSAGASGNITVTSGSMNVKDASYLGNGTNTITNNGGTINLTAGTLSHAITNTSGIVDVKDGTLNAVISGGEGKTTISGTVTANAAISNGGGIEIASGKSLTIDATNLQAETANDGTLNLGAGDLVANIQGLTAATGYGDVIIKGAVTNTNGKTIKQKSLTIDTAGSLITDADKLYLTESTIINNGVVDITGGTLSEKITGNGTINIGDGTNTNLVKYTGLTVIGNKTVVKNHGQLDPLADTLNADTTVEAGGELYLSGGTLGVDIKGTGTTFLKAEPTSINGSTVVFGKTGKADVEIAGTLNLSGGIMNTQGTGVNNLKIGVLTGNGNIQFDAVIDGTAAGKKVTVDTIEVGSITGTPVIVLDSISVSGSSTLAEWAVGTAQENIPFIKSTAGITSLTVNKTSSGSADGFLYEFEQQAANSGELKVTKLYGYNLAQIVQNNKATADNHSPNEIGTFSFVQDINLQTAAIKVRKSDTTLTPDINHYATLNPDGSVASGNTNLGTLAARSAGGAFTINGGGKVLDGGDAATYNGITIASAVTLNLMNIGEIKGFGYFIDNQAGTVNISGTTKLNSKLQGAGTYNLTGGVLTVDNLSNLAMTTLNNNGTVTLGDANDQELTTTTISGGDIVIAGNVKADAGKLAGTITIRDDKTLTLTGGAVGGKITIDTLSPATGSGKLVIDGDVTNGKTIKVANLNIASGSLTTDIGNLAIISDISNVGTLILTDADGTLNNNLTGAGTLQIGKGTDAVTVTSAEDVENAVTVNANATFTNTGNISGAVTIEKNGTMESAMAKLTSTTAISNKGTLKTGGSIGTEIKGESSDRGNLVLTTDSVIGKAITYQDIDLNGKTLTINTGTSYLNNTDSIILSNGTINMQGSAGINVVTIDKLSENGGIKFDATIDGAAAIKVVLDTINANDAGGTISLESVNLAGIASPDSWVEGITVDNIAFITAGAHSSPLTLTQTVTATSDGKKYVFEQGTNAGTLKVTKGHGGTLADVVQNRSVGTPSYAMGNIATYSLIDDYATAEDLGTFKGVGTDDAQRTLTIAGNSHNMSGANNYNGIKLRINDTLNLANMNVSGFKDYFIDNSAGGTVNMGGNITLGSGSVIKGAMNVEADGNVTTYASNLWGTVNNSGVVTLIGNTEDGTGILNNVITGTGILNIGNDDIQLDVITANAKIGDVNINHDGTLIINANNLTGATTNNGILILDGDGTLNNPINGSGMTNIGDGEGVKDTTVTANVALGAVTVNTDGTLITNAANLQGAVTNNGIITLTGTGEEGILAQEITGGILNIGNDDMTQLDVITANAKIGDVNINPDGTLIINANNLTGATANNGVLILNGDGTLNNPIIGTGMTNIGDGVGENDTTVTAIATLGAVNINSDGTLIIDAKNLDGAVTNGGTLTLTGTGDDNILDQNVTGAGTINIGNDDATADVITANTPLGPDGTLNINPDGTLIISGNNLKVAPNINDGGNLVLTGGELSVPLTFGNRSTLNGIAPITVGAGGSITQAAGSNIVISAPLVEAVTNDVGKAFFQGINDAGQLDVGAGNLTVIGEVYDGMYYVLVAGTAISDKTLTEDKIWKLDNIDFKDMLMTDYEVKYDTSSGAAPGSIALHVKSTMTVEEGNTSGLAAVQQGAITVSKEFTGEVENHLSMMTKPSLSGKKYAKARNVASTTKDDYKVEVVEQGKATDVMPVKFADKDKYDKEVWASYIRTKETTEGMKLGEGLSGNNTAQYNGAVVGVDFYSSKKAIAGVALSYSTGDINSYSNGTSTVNKSKYYGIALYDRVTNGNTALIYDIGYIRGDNDINQYYKGKDTTSDVRTNTYTAGARWEAAIATGKSKIVPFAAFRYMRMNNGDYTNSHNVKIDTKNQNLYIPKVGIAWTGDFIMPKSVWTWRPSVEAGYVWNLGDRNAESNFFVGTRTGNLDYDVADKSSYYAKAGMEFMCKNFTAGVSYRYLKGDAVRNNKWNVNVSWNF